MNRLIAHMTASHCCVCQRELTDAESVEMGIGPVCSRQYYDPAFTPNAEQIKTALGLLQASDIPDHIIDGFLSFVDNLEGHEKDNARKACNLLVYWASCRYHFRKEVLCCAAIIRALGYTTLADKLEIDRTAAFIEDKGTHLHVLVGKMTRFERDMKYIPKAVRLDEKSGSKVGWNIPIAEKKHFMAILGFHYGNEMASGDGKPVWVIPKTRASDVLFFRRGDARRPVQNDANKGKDGVCVVVCGNTIKVNTPFNTDYIEALKRYIPWQKRKWTGGCWEVSTMYWDTVRNLLKTHFGVSIN